MDLQLFRLINGLSGRFDPLDDLMIIISKKIRFIYLLVFIFMLLKNRASKRIAIESGFSVFISLILHMVIKLFFYKARPFRKRKVGILIPSKMDSSFPSKHTLLAFAASTTIFWFYRTFGKIMLWLSVLTGFSRIWVGHHYPSDVAGSAVLGVLSSLAARLFGPLTFNK